MDRWFATLASHSALPRQAAEALVERGFVVLPGPIPAERMPAFQAAYDEAVATADPGDVHRGRTSTRINDFVNRGAAFDPLSTWPPALDAACRVVGKPFQLSVMHARTLNPGVSAQELHADIPRTSDAWPMLSMILMVDEFRDDNGATRLVPGTHRRIEPPEDVLPDRLAPHPDEVLATGPAGTVILFNASIWHGHSANRSAAPRRSIQATFIPRTGRQATDFAGRMSAATRERLGPAAKFLVGIDESSMERTP